MAKEKSEKRCEICGASGVNVDLVIDPLNPDKEIIICDECYGKRLEELNPKEKETDK